MDELIQRTEEAIARHHLLADGESVVVGVSGGVDSMVLFHVLRTLSAKHRWKLVVAHFNHQLRGKDADADERFVMNAAKKLGLAFTSERQDVKTFARASSLSVEMAARKLRHEFLARTAKQFGSRFIALAHHADDQVELFFLRLLRGAGAQGLGGMKWKAPCPVAHDITLFRPLLGESKTALMEFAHAHRIKSREDATNRSADILRNRIRHKLLPLLRRDYQPAIDRAALRSMELVSDESDFLGAEAARWLKNKRREPFDSIHGALQRRIVQLGLLAHGIVPQFEHIENLRANPNQWLTVGGGFVCRRIPNGDIEARNVTSIRGDETSATVHLGLRTRNALCDSVRISWKFLRGAKLPQARPRTEFFDADAVGESIELRHWRAGDRFQPIGMANAIKLQDFFVNQKIPRVRRHELLIATTGDGEIFWVEGQRIGERFKVTPETKRILRWHWVKV